MANLAQINEQLKNILLEKMSGPGDYPQAVEGLTLHWRQEVNKAENCFFKPLVSVIVQGFKRSIWGNQEYHYGENQCVVCGVDMPSASFVMEASPERPFLVISLDLNNHLISTLAADLPQPENIPDIPAAVAIAEAEADLLEAFWRLLQLMEKPDQIPVLAPLIIRELHYRLLIGPHGGHLRAINAAGSLGNQVARAITWLRQNYKEQLQVDQLAKRVNMATSTFHRHFRQVTSLSPLQYQKHLRLYEAQRLMMVEHSDAANASLAVGYESPTQFNREYKRLFGEPPHRDVVRRVKSGISGQPV